MKSCTFVKLKRCERCINYRMWRRGDFVGCFGCYYRHYDDARIEAECKLVAIQYLLRLWDRDRFGEGTWRFEGAEALVEEAKERGDRCREWLAKVGAVVVERDRRKVRQMMCDLMTQYNGSVKSAAEWFQLMRFSDDKSGEVYKPSARLPV